MKKITRMLLILVIALAITSIACGCTTAAWVTRRNTSSSTNVHTTKVNGSEKYIVYAALDEDGALIPESDDTTASAYAVVGYTGTVAELTIPEKYAGKSVTKVLAVTDYTQIHAFRNGSAYSGNNASLAGNSIIRSIVFGANVGYIASAVCNSLDNLTTITFNSESAVVLDSYAFLNCSKLATVTGTYTDSNSNAFSGTAVA